jgi:hypothetical protein
MNLIRLAGLITILRDDLEEEGLDKELAEQANSFLKLLNERLEVLTNQGEQVNDTLILITQVIEGSLKEIGL